MFIRTEVAGADGSGLSRVVLRADMRDYDFETVRLNTRPDSVTLRASRKDTSTSMLTTLDTIVDRLEMTSNNLDIDRDTMRDLLAQQDGTVAFRLMAEVIVEDGENTLVAHEDAPAFFEFTQLVEAMPAPASFRSATAFAPGEPSAETFRTGEIAVVPALDFTLTTQEEINQLGQALFNHSVASDCI